jgi:hypothetical protein
MRTFILFTFALCGLAAAGQSPSVSPSKNATKMSVAVWDTYVKKRDGSVMHFDIIVPSAMKDTKTIHGYGKAYLSSKNEADGKIDTEECQFCHIEAAGPDMVAAIKKDGHYILEMDDVPATLPANPSRRDLVLHLRGHYIQYRFANLQGKTAEELQAIINQ